jgi:hypothetical protein
MAAQPESRISLFVVGTLLGLAVFAATGSKGIGVQAAKAPARKATPQEEATFPHMDQALAYLGAAKRELQEAKPWFGDHREKALDHVNAAIKDVQSGIDEYMAKHPSATRNQINPDTIEVKMGHHFSEAQRLTQQSLDELNKASAIFYGKRDEALNEIKAAIAEMQAGDAYYKAHPQNQ